MRTEEEFTKLDDDEHELLLSELAFMLTLIQDYGDSIQTEIADFYRKYGKDGVVTYNDARKYISNKDRRRRIAVLLLAISDILDDLISEIAVHFRKVLVGFAEKEYDFFDLEVPSELDFSLIWGDDSQSWETRLKEDKNLWLSKIEADLRQYFIRQRKLDDTLNQVSRRMTSTGKAVENLLNTESTAYRSKVRKDVFKEAGVSKYQFWTNNDERTCEICGSIHGMIFPISQYEIGVTASPLHPRCRCWEVPIYGQ